MNQTVNNPQNNITPSQPRRNRVPHIQHRQSQNCSIELRRLFQQVVEVVRRPLDEGREFRRLFLLDEFGIEIDVVFGKGWGSAVVEETLDCECPETEADERAEEGFAADDERRGHCVEREAGGLRLADCLFSVSGFR